MSPWLAPPGFSGSRAVETGELFFSFSGENRYEPVRADADAPRETGGILNLVGGKERRHEQRAQRLPRAWLERLLPSEKELEWEVLRSAIRTSEPQLRRRSRGPFQGISGNVRKYPKALKLLVVIAPQLFTSFHPISPSLSAFGTYLEPILGPVRRFRAPRSSSPRVVSAVSRAAVVFRSQLSIR